MTYGKIVDMMECAVQSHLICRVYAIFFASVFFSLVYVSRAFGDRSFTATGTSAAATMCLVERQWTRGARNAILLSRSLVFFFLISDFALR